MASTLKKAHKAPRTVKAENGSNSGSLEDSTEEDALHEESRLMTRDVYHGPHGVSTHPEDSLQCRVSRAELGGRGGPCFGPEGGAGES